MLRLVCTSSEAQKKPRRGGRRALPWRKSGSQLTHGWRKPDSNFSSLSGSVPLRAGGAVPGNHMVARGGFLSLLTLRLPNRFKQAEGEISARPDASATRSAVAEIPVLRSSDTISTTTVPERARYSGWRNRIFRSETLKVLSRIEISLARNRFNQ